MFIRLLTIFIFLSLPTLGYARGPYYLLSRVVGNKIIKVSGKNVPSKGHFWPASSIKILPAIAVLEWAKKNNIKLDDILRISEPSGIYCSTLRNMIRQTLVWSSNIEYDRLVRLAGMDFMNILAKRLGLVNTWISSSFASGTLRSSPAVYHRSAHGWIYIKPRYSRGTSRCRQNCTSLKDLQKMLLIASRYPTLKKFLKQSLSNFRSSVTKKFGGSTKIYSKSGFTWSGYIIGNGMWINRKGEQYILTIVLKTRGKSYESNRLRVEKIASKLLNVL